MADRAKYAFGNSQNIQTALDTGVINAFDILFLDGDTNPKVGWIDKQGNPVIVDNECVIIINGETLPEFGEMGKVYIFGDEGYFWNGTKFVNMCKPTDLTALESEVAEKADADEIESSYEKIKYEITSTPEGTLVNYGEKEIRVMCPANTKWIKQNVGETGNANMYYMGFKAYAPEGAVGFKEGDKGIIIDEMFDFNGDFAGTDEFGRNYSICWLALASYDEATDTWTYFGKNSTTSKYIGWDYVVEWYNADNVIIASDSVRINLSNEDCHSLIEPYYMGTMMKKVEEMIAETTAIEVVEF